VIQISKSALDPAEKYEADFEIITLVGSFATSIEGSRRGRASWAFFVLDRGRLLLALQGSLDSQAMAHNARARVEQRSHVPTQKPEKDVLLYSRTRRAAFAIAMLNPGLTAEAPDAVTRQDIS